MRDRFIVNMYDENEELKSSIVCKSYRQIAKETGEEYHVCRNIHLIGNGTIVKKFVHPMMKKLQKRLQILDI